MPGLYGVSGGVNRQIKKLYANVSGVNRELKELWARDSSGVNRKIFSAFSATWITPPNMDIYCKQAVLNVDGSIDAQFSSSGVEYNAICMAVSTPFSHTNGNPILKLSGATITTTTYPGRTLRFLAIENPTTYATGAARLYSDITTPAISSPSTQDIIPISQDGYDNNVSSVTTVGIAIYKTLAGQYHVHIPAGGIYIYVDGEYQQVKF